LESDDDDDDVQFTRVGGGGGGTECLRLATACTPRHRSILFVYCLRSITRPTDRPTVAPARHATLGGLLGQLSAAGGDHPQRGAVEHHCTRLPR